MRKLKVYNANRGTKVNVVKESKCNYDSSLGAYVILATFYQLLNNMVLLLCWKLDYRDHSDGGLCPKSFIKHILFMKLNLKHTLSYV